MNAHRPGTRRIWPLAGRRRAPMIGGRGEPVADEWYPATMVESLRTRAVADRPRGTGTGGRQRRRGRARRNPWMPALAASRERVVSSAILRVSGDFR